MYETLAGATIVLIVVSIIVLAILKADPAYGLALGTIGVAAVTGMLARGKATSKDEE